MITRTISVSNCVMNEVRQFILSRTEPMSSCDVGTKFEELRESLLIVENALDSMTEAFLALEDSKLQTNPEKRAAYLHGAQERLAQIGKYLPDLAIAKLREVRSEIERLCDIAYSQGFKEMKAAS